MLFYQTPRVPELLIAGRQAPYFLEFLRGGVTNRKSVTETDARRYAQAYAAPAQLRSGLEIYRGFPADATFNAAQHAPTDLPLLLVGGDGSFGPILPVLAASLRAQGWSKVSVKVLANNRHYIVDEHPDTIAQLIEETAAP
jgi:pimeloyl-ACP methyl ester carboxylesterase